VVGLVVLARHYGFPATWSGVGAMFQLWFWEPKQMPRDYREAVPILRNRPFSVL